MPPLIKLLVTPQVSIVARGGELSVVDTTTSRTMSTVQADCSSTSHVVSTQNNKKLAYLLDQNTIAIKDLVSSGQSTLSHNTAVDFLELNSDGNHILFRDEKRGLHLYHVHSQSSSALTNNCIYAQWVSNSNVIVAQRGRFMLVWYNCQQPEHVVTTEITGKIIGIERWADKTNVIVQNGASQATHELQMDLIGLWSFPPTSEQNPSNEATKDAHYQWLLATHQLEKAAEIKEKDGDALTAAKLYADSGLPLMAAQLVSDYGIKRPRSLLEGIACALENDGVYEKASEILVRMDRADEALQTLLARGKDIAKAIEFSRVYCPEQIGALEKEYGIQAKSMNETAEQQESSTEIKDEPIPEESPVKEPTVDDLLLSGQFQEAFDIFSSKGDWDALWAAASSHSIDPNLLSEYAATRARQLMDDEEEEGGRDDTTNAALALLTQYCPDYRSPKIQSMYDDLARRILHRPKQEEDKGGKSDTLLPKLKDLLFTAASKHGIESSPDFCKLLHATHYFHMMQLCCEHGLDDLGVKCAITLLRFSELMGSDKSCYLAGMLCKDKGHTNLAFLLLNRYVDLVEAIDEQESSIDESDFADPDIIPSIVRAPIPSTHYCSNEESREDVRDWVLSTCMDEKIEKELPSATNTIGTIYAGLFQSDVPNCIVTGYPVCLSDQIMVDDGHVANRRDWNKFVSKTKKNPWTGREDARPST